VCRRIDVEPNDILQLIDIGDVVGKLELAKPMRRQTMGSPDLLNGAGRNAHDLGHRLAGPMRRFRWCLMQRFVNDLRDHRVWDRRFARRPGLVVQQAVDTIGHETLLPSPHRACPCAA